MENDDKQVGKILSRRDVLKLFGLAGAAALSACAPGAPQAAATTRPAASATAAPQATQAASATVVGSLPACIVRPALTEGPYYVDEMLNRSDIRSDPSDGSVSEGIPLELTFLVSQISGSCAPLAGAIVDIWHCDAQGVYSGVNGQQTQFLRGHQVTDSNGVAKFITIYPGWYPGRAVHIHFKIRSGTYEFVSQLFFDDALSDQVYTQAPYAGRGERTPRNEGDSLYRNGGSQLQLDVKPVTDGYAATFDIGLNIM